MSDYEKGYKEGYDACMRELIENPVKLFGFLPDIAEANKKRLDNMPDSPIKDALLKGLRGEITSTELIKTVRNAN